MEGGKRGTYLLRLDFHSSGLCTIYYITVTSFRRRILVFTVQVHNGRGKKKGDLFGFPFLWPVYNLLHDSYIIQERIIAFTR